MSGGGTHEQVLSQRLSESYGLDTRPLAGPIRELLTNQSRERQLPPGHVVSELVHGSERWNRVLDGLFLGHTRFYRHPRVWEYLATRVREFQWPLRVLIAGCSTGQEAVTLGLMLDAANPGKAFEIVAVDANEVALEKARRGFYSVQETAPLPPAWVKKGFDQRSETMAQVAPWLADRIRYGWANLIQGVPPGPFHLVLIRNVLTYLLPSAVEAVLGHLQGVLAADGLLVIAPQETHLLARWSEAEAVAPGLPIYRMCKAKPQTPQRLAGRVAAPAAKSATPQGAQSEVVALLGQGIPRVVVSAASLSLHDEAWQHLEESLLAHLKAPPEELAFDLRTVQFVDASAIRKLRTLITLLGVSGTRLRWDALPVGWKSAAPGTWLTPNQGEHGHG